MTRNLKQYQEIYLRYNQSESALSICAMTMMKILNGLAEMSYTEFHRYEKKMLWRAMKLFSEQCIQQIDSALACQEVEKKKEYISDIEFSITEITDVYKNIMGESSNAERQMFQSLSVDIKIHDLSPKLCAFYSSILDKVVEMFREDGAEYAFILHPVLQSTIEAKVLLEKREQSGKVVIIYVSESVIEEFDLVSICLLHEAFHVLTKYERMRRERAKNFLLQMTEQIRRKIFEDVSFGANSHEVKEELCKRWFGGVAELLDKFSRRGWEDKCFYGQNIKSEVENKIKECLRYVSKELENTLPDVVFKAQIAKEYAEYQKQAFIVEKAMEKIRDNIFYIVSENLISEIANQLMFIYREAYADISCILLLKIDPLLYHRAFFRSIQFEYSESAYVDDAKELRENLVAEIVARNISSEDRISWVKFRDSMMPHYKETEQKKEEKQLPTDKFCGTIKINSVTKRKYEDYLTMCARSFSARLDGIGSIAEFRNRMRQVIMDSPQQVLRGILAGDIL